MPTDLTDRARAALYGHALGDSYGAPLEFLRGPTVRTRLVDTSPGSFRWTDDTHMSLYLARALLDHGPGPLDEDRLGACVGRRFVQWLDDPFMPLTAPGGTCLKGATAFQRTGDWRSSGDRESDGCGAVMRVPPLPLRFAGEELRRAARVQALVTHAHPNAVEAAVAACHILRQLLEGSALNAELVLNTADLLHGPWSEGGTVARSLRDAVELATDEGAWLDEARVHPGDGGWRSGSALGLGLAAALRWAGDLREVIDRAARIDGDSDSVACLAGLYAGAAAGTAALPADWMAALLWRAELDAAYDPLLESAAKQGPTGDTRV